MKHTLSQLPKETGSYGFIHNDNHQGNIFVQGKQITLMDFDCVCRQFFMQDIITPVQGIMFDEVGGMMAPFTNVDKLKHFFECFLEGYEAEYHLEDKWYQQIPTFLNYRRMLLFTCMQDWLSTQPELKRAFKAMILELPLFQI